MVKKAKVIFFFFFFYNFTLYIVFFQLCNREMMMEYIQIIHSTIYRREGEERLTRVEVETTTHVTQGEDGEANVEEGTEVDTTLFNVEKGGDPPGAGPSTEDDFKGLSHYRCRLCQYKCLDRSCMSRHVKYMHLRIHPHSCPFCGYSNVEKTKVQILILSFIM